MATRSTLLDTRSGLALAGPFQAPRHEFDLHSSATTNNASDNFQLFAWYIKPNSLKQVRYVPFVVASKYIKPNFFILLSSTLRDVGRGRHITATAGPVDVDVLTLGEGLAGVLGLDAESVGTEVITLSLQQVGGQVLGAVAVVEAEGSGEGRQRDTPDSRLADNVAPAALGGVDGLGEELIEQQVLEVGVVAVGVGDVLKEDGADNAATTPHEGDGRLVQLPVVLLSSLCETD